jgi:hypothetical protein
LEGGGGEEEEEEEEDKEEKCKEQMKKQNTGFWFKSLSKQKKEKYPFLLPVAKKQSARTPMKKLN